MKIAKDVLVHIEYKITDEQNNLLNPEDDELIYLHGGYGHVFQALENALEGKEEGDSFKATFTPAESFGEYNEELVFEEALEDLPEDIYVGMELDADDEEDSAVYVITDVQEDVAVLDANHPFAGHNVTFDGRITQLQELNPQEIQEILEHDMHEH